MTNATIETNLIPISRVIQDGWGTHLTIDVPNGWDDCKKLTKKILSFDGKKFCWVGWDSDRNECFFRETTNVATITKLKKV